MWARCDGFVEKWPAETSPAPAKPIPVPADKKPDDGKE